MTDPSSRTSVAADIVAQGSMSGPQECHIFPDSRTRSPSYLGALLVAGLDADQIGHVLELVGGYAGR